MNFTNKSVHWSHSRVVRGRILFAGGSWGAGSNATVATSIFFIFFHRFFPFGFLLFILTADPVSFARFFRKHISSLGNVSLTVATSAC